MKRLKVEIIWLNASKENLLFLVTRELDPHVSEVPNIDYSFEILCVLRKSNESAFQLKIKFFAQVLYLSSL